MADHELEVGVGELVFLYSAVQLGNTVVVIGDVGIQEPGEVPNLESRTGNVELGSAVGHGADIVPVAAESVVGVGLRHEHQEVVCVFVVELEVHVQPVPECEVEGEVGGPGGLPAQVLVTLGYRCEPRCPDIVSRAAHEGEVVVVRDLGVSGCSAAQGYLCVCQPAAGRSHEVFVEKVPHEAHRAEPCPAAVPSEP